MEIHWLQDSRSSEAVEGYYIKNEGVLFSVSLPVHFHESLSKPFLPPRKVVSQWERVQRELRGEKIEADSGAPEQKNETVADAVLRLLAENGQHFSQLPENERLTVAITLRASRCESCHNSGGASWNKQNGTTNWATPHDTTSWATPQTAVGNGTAAAGGKMGAMMGGAAGGMMGAMGSQKIQGQPAQASAMQGMMSQMMGSGKMGGAGLNAADQQTKGLETEARDQVLLGDLNEKQGRHQDAVTAYQKAVGIYQRILDGKGGNAAAFQDPRAAMQSYLTAVEYANKLAQAQQAAGDADKAVTALKQVAKYSTLAEQLAARELARKEHDQNNKAQDKTTSNERATTLPPKLIISAPKKLLDLVGAGKISFDDFRKAATVEYLGADSSTGPKPAK
jgi:tetratricopeptide (TPR) repeat protein